MLQMNPKLDASMVKQFLQQSARADAFTGAVPNPQWGYGKADAYNALLAVQTTLPLLSQVVLTNQQAKITVQHAVPGWQYVLQTSTDLVSWSSVLTNMASTNVFQMLDSSATNKARFYRVIIP